MLRQWVVGRLRRFVPARLRKLAPAWLKKGLKPIVNRVERIDPRQTYCVLAWKHLQINPEGTAKLCCRASGSLCDNSGHLLTLDAHSLPEIWNSPHMQEVRRKMVQGERVPDCASCYDAEAAGVASYRTESNEKWLGQEGRSVDEALADASAHLKQPVDLPVYYQLNLGNLCNLKCRMCSSSYSSQIESDPVHSAWSPRIPANDSGLARWSGETLHLQPGQIIEVHEHEAGEGCQTKASLTWKGGDSLSLPLSPIDVLTELSFKVHASQPTQRVRIVLNGETVHEGPAGAADWPTSFDLRQRNLGSRLNLRIVNVAGGQAPLQLEEVTLRRTVSSAKKAGFSNVSATRFEEPGDWYRQDSVIFGEILKNAEKLEELYFTGGEPLISPKFREIINTLVERGAAKQLTLQLNSNVTIVPDELLAQFAKFKQVTFTLSIDAALKTYEYIRYPAKWATVAENIRRIAKTLPNADITAMSVLTAYNLLYLPELFRFLDTLKIKFRILHCMGPDWLGIHVLPTPVLEEAGRRYFAYLHAECLEENRHVVHSWAEAFATKGRVQFSPGSYAAFNEFTNDLDGSRQQDFARTFPDLLELIERSGCIWSKTASRVHLLQLGKLSRAAS